MTQFLQPGMVKFNEDGSWSATVIHFELGEVLMPHKFHRIHDAKRTMRFWVEIANGSGMENVFRYWWAHAYVELSNGGG